MDVLIIGYGSAGKRHAKILNLSKKIKNIYIKTNQKIESQKKFHFVKNIENLNPDLIVVANETYLHYSICKFLEKKFSNKIILCEKPLFHKFYNFQPKKNKFYITYNFRFHKCLQYLKNKISLDEAFFVDAECSSYLPKWRKNVDYSKNYSAFPKKGGGVLLDMSHEIDYLKWLFESFKILKIYKNRISNLNILSDDIALIFGEIKKNTLVKIKLTYFNKIPKRCLTICLKNGTQIYLDLLNSQIKLFSKNKKKTFRLEKYSQHKTTKYMYSEILRNNYKDICSLKEGIDLLRQIKNSKKEIF
jgi:CMP-N,N'-diacetyllegionaminic acid synthase